MSDPARRLFLALIPDDAVRDAIAAHQARWSLDAQARPTRAAMLHLTLHFLGSVDAAHEQALREALGAEVLLPFDLALRTPAHWDNHVTVLLPDANPALEDLRARLADRLLRARLAVQAGAWTPHVTLARDARLAAPPNPPMRPIHWSVREAALVWSRRERPASYEVLGRYGAI